jgi:bifunctional non-homologous end joining protein LigD
LRGLSLVERRSRLESLVEASSSPAVAFSRSFTDGKALLAHCDKLGLEGVVSKRKDAPYRSGRTTAWVKCKCAAWKAANRDRYRLFEKVR